MGRRIYIRPEQGPRFDTAGCVILTPEEQQTANRRAVARERQERARKREASRRRWKIRHSDEYRALESKLHAAYAYAERLERALAHWNVTHGRDPAVYDLTATEIVTRQEIQRSKGRRVQSPGRA